MMLFQTDRSELEREVMILELVKLRVATTIHHAERCTSIEDEIAQLLRGNFPYESMSNNELATELEEARKDTEAMGL